MAAILLKRFMARPPVGTAYPDSLDRATDPRITQANIDDKICRPGRARIARPPADWQSGTLMEELFQPVPFETVAKRDGDGNNGSTDKGDAQ